MITRHQVWYRHDDPLRDERSAGDRRILHDLRRTRAASQSIIPVDTNWRRRHYAYSRSFNLLNFEAIAVRVPTINVDGDRFRVTVKKPVKPVKSADLLQKAAQVHSWYG